MELIEDGEQHECVICTKKEESTENSPIGLIVLMQPSTSNFFLFIKIFIMIILFHFVTFATTKSWYLIHKEFILETGFTRNYQANYLSLLFFVSIYYSSWEKNYQG